MSANSLVASLWPVQSKSSEAIRGAVLIAAGVAIMALSAKAQIPFYPVPMTLQSLVLLMIGAAYGAPLAFATGIAYLAAGAMGYPVFAGTPEKGIGLAYMVGPTAGYLAAFPIAMWIAGKTAEVAGFVRLVVGFLAAHAVIFIGGFAWMAQLFGTEKAWMLGVAPFILVTVVKSALAVAAHMGLLKVLGR